MRVDVLLKRKNYKVKIILEEDFIKQPFLKLYAKLKENTNGINKKQHADESSARNFENEIYPCVSMCLKKEKHQVKITLEEDFIKQPFLKLYAKLKGNTNGTKKPHADESGARDFEKENYPCVSMCLKQETNQVKITMEEDFIKQAFLQLHAKHKGNTNGIKKQHADESGARDFEGEIYPCVSMCLQKEKKSKSK